MGKRGESFVLYRSVFEATAHLDDKEFRSIICALADYAFERKIPEFNGALNSIFVLVKPSIDASLKRYEAAVENGKQGGRPPSNQQPDGNQTETREEPEENQKYETGNLTYALSSSFPYSSASSLDGSSSKKSLEKCVCGGTLRETTDGKTICLTCLKEQRKGKL